MRHVSSCQLSIPVRPLWPSLIHYPITSAHLPRFVTFYTKIYDLRADEDLRDSLEYDRGVQLKTAAAAPAEQHPTYCTFTDKNHSNNSSLSSSVSRQSSSSVSLQAQIYVCLRFKFKVIAFSINIMTRGDARYLHVGTPK